MKTTGVIALCAACLLATPAFAAAPQQPTRDSHAVHAAQIGQQKKAARHQQAARSSPLQAGRLMAGGTFGGPNGPYANPYRAYPPSCMADPLPDNPIGPIYRKSVDLAAYVPSEQGYAREPVTITIWREPCSSAKQSNAITLMRIERSSSHDGQSSQFINFPALSVSQGSVDFDDPDGYDLPRVAEEPNTVVAWTPNDSAVIYSTTYVLENYPLPDAPEFDYTQAFTIRFDNFFTSGQSQFYIDVPAYDPANYDRADEPLPINGYMSANYFDPDHNGEGIVVQVMEISDASHYQLAFDWFTFGPDGKPFWIAGDAAVEPGDRQVTAPALYSTNGGFAGNFGASTQARDWGTVSFQWQDCNHVQLTFDANADLPADVPQGSGTLHWVRIANVNGLTCE